MSTPMRIQKIGTDLGVVLPQSALDALALTEGDELYLTVDSGTLRIAPYDPRLAEVLEDAREFMTTHRQMFEELAK